MSRPGATHQDNLTLWSDAAIVVPSLRRLRAERDFARVQIDAACARSSSSAAATIASASRPYRVRR